MYLSMANAADSAMKVWLDLGLLVTLSFVDGCVVMMIVMGRSWMDKKPDSRLAQINPEEKLEK